MNKKSTQPEIIVTVVTLLPALAPGSPRKAPRVGAWV